MGARCISCVFLLPLVPLAASAFPPTNASWTRMVPNPVLTPTEPWEGTTLCENVAFWEPRESQFRMWYRGGWATGAVGAATSPDGLTWTKHTKNPVYGQGASGFPDNVQQPWVLRGDGAGYVLYTTHGLGLSVAVSPDGYNWTTVPSNITLPNGSSGWGNRVVWKEVEGADFSYKMLQQAMTPKGIWETFLYTSKDGFVFNISNKGEALTSLQPTPGGVYGGTRFASVDGVLTPKDAAGVYQLWYHASSAPGNLPTDIYQASSKDLINWVHSKTPVLRHQGGSSFEHDQVAGPVPVVVGKRAFLFYDGDNNVIKGGAASIGGATAPAVGNSIANMFV